VQSSHNASGYFTILGDEAEYSDHFNARLVTGATGEVYARTGYLGFLRRTEPGQQGSAGPGGAGGVTGAGAGGALDPLGLGGSLPVLGPAPGGEDGSDAGSMGTLGSLHSQHSLHSSAGDAPGAVNFISQDSL